VVVDSTRCTHPHFEIRCTACRSSWLSSATIKDILPRVFEACEVQMPREDIIWFADEMEKQMRRHDAERGEYGWKDLTESQLLEMLQLSVKDLALEVLLRGDVMRKAANVANYACMFARLHEERIHKTRSAA
jgi:hypothetical protein